MMSINTDTVEKKARRAITEYKMLKKGDSVIVGLSGGADSVCLLHLLNSLKNEYELDITASHINHGIRGVEALFDAEFSEKFSKTLNVPFELLNADCITFAKENNMSVEEAGRKIRYDFFEFLKKDENTLIATAHNSNDNAETVVFNLARGSALAGVSGIPPKRNNIIRPLIYCTREEIEGYCNENSLKYVTDSTNNETEYTRNKIRHNILPLLKEINSGAVDAVSRFSSLAREDEAFLSDLAYHSLEASKKDKNSYFIEDIISLKEPIKKRVISFAITDFSGEIPDFKKIKAVSDLINTNGKIQLYKNCYCEAKDGILHFFGDTLKKEALPQKTLNSLEFSESFSDFYIKSEKYTENSKKINYSLLDNLIDCDTIIGKLVLRSKENGDKITLKKRNVTKTLKKLFNEENIPVSERAEFPVLSDDKGIVWVYKFGTNKRNFPTEKSKNIISIEVKKK